MPLTKGDVDHIARLARLALSGEEKDRLLDQLGKILEHVSRLKELDTEGVPPTTHVLPLKNVWKEDRIVPPPGVEAMLANAPDREGPYFKVKKVIE